MIDYQTIPGWFDYEDVYRQAVKDAPLHARFVEIGAWLGKSTVFLAQEIIRSGKAIDLTVVDHWCGDDGAPEQQAWIAEHGDPYPVFVRNMAWTHDTALVWRSLAMHSVRATCLVPDASIDFLMLDGGHGASIVRDDLLAWWPKIKPGGVLAGHDFTAHWPGLVGAVLRFFNGRPFEVRGACWVHRKEKS